MAKQQTKSADAATSNSTEVQYTLKDLRLYVPGFGLLERDPKNIKPLSEEQLKAVFKCGEDNGYTKEQMIKKYLVRLKLKEQEEVIPVEPETVDSFEIDNE